MKVLVLGGAGYIGSHMVKVLVSAGHEVVTVDSLVTGHRDAVVGGTFLCGDIGDRAFLSSVFAQSSFDGVMHFAAFSQVGESVRDPAKYYRNNCANALTLLDEMVAAGVRNIIFSSTAAIFGEPRYTPIDEDHPTAPINPYGRSKLFVEQALQDYDRAYGLRSVSLRYFNAAGADAAAGLGERHEPETHLIPLVLQVATGRREAIQVFGTDYPTPDGTCVRDYIHVSDLCNAHVLALEYLMSGGETTACNLGIGNGFSVGEVIHTVRKLTGRPIKVIAQGRREGDPAVLIANSGLARSRLGWSPHYTSLESMIGSAWEWELRRG